MKTSNRFIALLIAAVLLLALGATVSFWAIAQMEVAAEARSHTRRVINTAEALLYMLSDVETGQRGFALTGDESFLDTYLTGRDRIPDYLGELREIVRIQAGQSHLEAMSSLIDAKLAESAQVIVLRRNHEMASMLALVKGGQGKRLMDAIRVEIIALMQIEESELAKLEQEYQSSMRQLFFIFLGVSLLALLSVLSFAYLIYYKSKERLKDLLHVETRHLLELQEEMNSQLQQANNAAVENEEKLSVTLNSIGDGVIATDSKARVTLLNPIAEQLTGWTQAEANGRLIDEVFHIINKETRLLAAIPVMETLAHGTVQGLANHTVLIARDGFEYDISDSCAPIRNRENELVGAVLVFRNVTEEYAAQHAFGLQQLELEMQNNELLQSRAALDASQARYFDLYDRAPVGYLTLSESGLIIEANASAAAMFNLDRAGLVKQSITRFVDQKDTDTYYQLRQQLMATGDPQACELRLCKSGDEQLWAHLSISSALDEGMPVLRMVMTDISARKQTEEALFKAGALQLAIFNSANFSSIATDANGVIQIFNVGAERMLGYAAADVMNKITPADISDPLEVIIRAEALSVELGTPISPGFEALVFKASRGIEDIYELTYIRKDGSRFPAVVSVTALRDEQNMIIGYLLIGTDNTARKEAESALVKAGALQSAIFNSANFSSIATDANGVIQIFNVGAERMLGYAAADVMNKITPADISDPQEVIIRAEALSVELDTPISPGFEALVFKASRGIEDIYELTYIRKDGSRFPAVVSVTALRDEQNMIIGYLLIGTDNTARKLVEEERALLDLALKAKNVELENARDVADEANLAKSDFLSSMSHELRTPLGAILGFAQLIESGTPQPTPNQKRSVDQILKAGWYLLELINEILDLAVIESGKLSLSIESVSLAEVLHECEAMIEPQAEKRGISVVFAKLEEVYFVKADRMRVKQILINLLSNSIKYNKAGGTVTVMCSMSQPDSIQISVRDTGDGLSADWLAQLFQPFNRLGQKANVEEGTGIGLVVCKRLVELMAGEIGVESTVGVGSVFWIKLKLTDEPKSTGHEDDAVVLDRLQNHGGEQRYTLLYVEDNPANLMLIEDIIARRLDIRLLSAKDGNAGVELARKALPDVILMDINLPGISGIKALEILANDSLTAHIPVIALSANALPRDIQRGLAAGFVGYLTKPIKIVELMQTLDQALKSVHGKSVDIHIEEV
ncbi:MAG: PAS domain S-box protein [Azonexus sp.]|nr:PAS domain S-box protein [Azonexus sp.]